MYSQLPPLSCNLSSLLFQHLQEVKPEGIVNEAVRLVLPWYYQPNVFRYMYCTMPLIASLMSKLKQQMEVLALTGSCPVTWGQTETQAVPLFIVLDINRGVGCVLPVCCV